MKPALGCFGLPYKHSDEVFATILDEDDKDFACMGIVVAKDKQSLYNLLKSLLVKNIENVTPDQLLHKL